MNNGSEKSFFSSTSEHFLRLIYLLTDVAAIVCAYFSALLLRFDAHIGEPLFTAINTFFGLRETGTLSVLFMDFYITSAPRIIGFLTLILVPLYAYADLYEGRRFLRRRSVAWNVIRMNALALFLFFVYFYLLRNAFHPRSMFLLIITLNVIYCLSFRAIAQWGLRMIRRRFSLPPCRVVLVGQPHETDFIGRYIDFFKPHDLVVVHRLILPPGGIWQDNRALIEAACRSHQAGLLIIADRSLDIRPIMEVLELCATLNIPCKVLSPRMNILVNEARIRVDRFLETPLVHFAAPRSWCRIALDHMWSVVAASILLVIASPLLLLTALVIRLTSPGPALFVQERLGFNQRPFRMFKFRTMHSKAEEMMAEIEALNESGEALFKIRKDPRITPFGRFLRRFSLDEFPQLLNVILGDMNIIGPRPLPQRDFANYYEKWHYNRHEGLPGLTCLWQVSGRSDVDFHNMCILDVYYLRNRSSVLDIKILLRTIGVVLFAKGAY